MPSSIDDKKCKSYHGITISVGGQELGRIKEWKAEPLTDEEVADYVPYPRLKTLGDPPKFWYFDEQGTIPRGAFDLWRSIPFITQQAQPNNYITTPGDVEEANLALQAQLEMWGCTSVGDTKKTSFPPECRNEFIKLALAVGYYISDIKDDVVGDDSTTENDLMAAYDFLQLCISER